MLPSQSGAGLGNRIRDQRRPSHRSTRSVVWDGKLTSESIATQNTRDAHAMPMALDPPRLRHVRTTVQRRPFHRCTTSVLWSDSGAESWKPMPRQKLGEGHDT
jgi:hypothetical protein